MKTFCRYTLISAIIGLWIMTTAITQSCSDKTESVDNSALSQVDEHAGHNHAPGEHHEISAVETNPEVNDWCSEHAVPESECTQCNPSLLTSFKERGDWCAGHNLPESHCRLCNPKLEFPQEHQLESQPLQAFENQIEISLISRPNTEICATNGALIQFAAASTVNRAGLSTQQISRGDMEASVEAPAEVVFDETKLNVITSTVPALVSQWMISPGDGVRIGDALALLQSPAIAELQANLLKALAAHNVQEKELARHMELKDKNLISDSEYEKQAALAAQAHAEFTSIKGLLKSAGLHDQDLSKIIESKTISNKFLLRAQSEGVVIRRIAQLGELLEAGQAFMFLADPQAMWIEAYLTERQIRDIEIGQTLTFTSDGHGMNRVGARVIWVSQYLDPHTRTGIARAVVIDPSAKLQAGQFGLVHIANSQHTQVLLVPRDAVQWEGCCNVVFVREDDIRYRPRKVNLLGTSGDYYQVEGDLKAGDEVVVRGAFLLKTELKKTSLGAGCCGLEAAG
jgi:cobalt-zinc-cadmium efflux system membrane fusion protein